MIKFTYNHKKELYIYDLLYNQIFPDRYPKQVLRKIRKEINIVPPADFVTEVTELIQNNWLEVENNFYKQLGKFYGKKLTAPNLTAYLTRTPQCPYNFEKGWFASPLFGHPEERNMAIMHELTHYFQPVELPRPIKEAVPVILNDRKVFQVYSNDRGHSDPEEQEWRKEIWKVYKNGGTFDDVLKKVKKTSVTHSERE